MRRVPLPDDHHCSRYCKPTAVGRDGLPTTAAFEIKPGEEYLSVNWLEFFAAPDLAAAVELVRKAFRRKRYGVRPNGRFAVVNVGAALAAIAKTAGRPGRIEHLPLGDDESHAGLLGYTADDLAVAVELRALIQPEHVHRAILDP